jgi:hypothetical protein
MLDQQLLRDLKRDADHARDRQKERIELRVRPNRRRRTRLFAWRQADDRAIAELDLVVGQRCVLFADNRRRRAVIRHGRLDKPGHKRREHGRAHLGVGIIAELLEELDHGREIRHAARQIRPRALE